MTHVAHQDAVAGKPRNGGLPRGVFIGAAALVLFTISASGLARVTDIGAQKHPVAAPVEQVSLLFTDRDDGGVAVTDASTGRVIHSIEPGANGFVRATLRGLVRERKRSGIDNTTPFTLTRWTNGELSLDDSTIGRSIKLGAFGPTNAQSFALMFQAKEHSK